MAKYVLPEGFIDSVSKGDLIDKETVERIVDGPVDQIEAMNLASFLGKAFKRAGKPIVFRTRHTNRCELVGIKALTDSEAVSYGNSAANSATRKLRKSLSIHQSVDHSKLDDETKRKNEVSLLVTSQRLLAIRQISARQIETVVYQSRSIAPFKR